MLSRPLSEGARRAVRREAPAGRVAAHREREREASTPARERVEGVAGAAGGGGGPPPRRDPPAGRVAAHREREREASTPARERVEVVAGAAVVVDGGGGRRGDAHPRGGSGAAPEG